MPRALADPGRRRLIRVALPAYAIDGRTATRCGGFSREVPMPPRALADPGRRRLCASAPGAMLAAIIGARVRAAAQPVNADHGRVIPPVPIPDIRVLDADGKYAGLADMVHGRATALHLMFTGCSTVCPIQGAIFAQVQALLPDQRERRIQLLSIGIEPFADTPAAMRAWLRRFDAHAGWTAAVPAIDDLDRVLRLFGRGQNSVENHATQVNIIDPNGDLIFRTQQLPSAESLADILRTVSALRKVPAAPRLVNP
jgi:protein SCO1/2